MNVHRHCIDPGIGFGLISGHCAANRLPISLIQRLSAALMLLVLSPVAWAEDDVAEELGLTPATGSLPIWSKPTGEAELSERARAISPSIMIVGHPEGGYGTAFVISRDHRLLATNAHVADILHQAGRLLVIGNESSNVFEVDQIWYHPGVIRMKEEGAYLFRSTDPALGKVSALSADVAVLHVAGNDPLPDALELAEPAEAEDLFARPVAMIGFPGHDTVSWPGIGQKVQATYRQGVVARATDFFNNGSVEAPDRQHLQHTMQSWGGFSGSPIFLANGHVAALHNSGSTWENKGRIASLAYGVRVDCLWEVLAYHRLDEKVPVPVSAEKLRLDRFAVEDPRIQQYQEARELVERGRIRSLEGEFVEAGDLFKEAIERMPNLASAHLWKAQNHTKYAINAMGGVPGALRTGRLPNLIRQLELALDSQKKALQLEPTDAALVLAIALTKWNIETARTEQKRPFESPELRILASDILKLDPLPAVTRANAYAVYGLSFADPVKAIPWKTKAIEARPFDYGLYEDRASIYEATRQTALAVADRRRAKELRTAQLAIYKAWDFATLKDDSKRNGAEAIRFAEQACRLTGYKSYDAVDTLAAAHAESGNFDEAVRWANEAVKLAPPEEKSDTCIRLRSYQKQKSWRQ
jgi:tetratricopeptide (TPR) repeat protein